MKYFLKKPLLSISFAIVLLLGGGCSYLVVNILASATSIPPETNTLNFNDIKQSLYQRDINKDEPVYFDIVYPTSQDVKNLREFVGALGGGVSAFEDFIINGQTIVTFSSHNYYSYTTLGSIYQEIVFEQANGIALSEATAKDLGVTLGDEITITADYHDWDNTELQVVVEHILKPNFDSLNPEYQDIYDKYFVYLPFMIISGGVVDELRERSEAITLKPNKSEGDKKTNESTYSSIRLYFDDYETAEKALNKFMEKIDEEASARD